VTTQGGGSAPGTRTRFGWLRAASDRVPTRWFAGIATGLFLVATAAFGGLATAETPPLAALEPGQEHRNDQLSIAVKRAVLVDELEDAGVYVEDGERVLALIVDVENTWSEPLVAAPDSSVTESFRIAGLAGREPDSVARYDDATQTPWLQPGVPAQLVLAWAVDADEFADADELEITLADLTLHVGSFVADGSWWTDPVPAATLVVPIDDVGAGA
jgi:hypothetical protein